MYDKEKTDYNNMKLYGILRGDSVSHKSGYINNFISTCIENLAGAKLLPELEASSAKTFFQETPSFNNELPPIEYLYITRMLIGSRIYEYDDVALNYIRPILSDMRSNHVSCQGLFNTPQNKRAEACQRRGADLVERIAVVFQNIFDTLKVLQPIESIRFDRIQKNTLDEIKNRTNSVFYLNETFTEVNDDPVYSDSIDLKDLNEVKITSVKREPPQSMKVGISVVKSAVHFFKNVIQLPINCFSISDLTYNRIFYNYKRDNIDVKAILSNLEKKCLLKHGKFLKVGSRSIDSWIKILSVPTNDEEFLTDRVENGIIYSAFCCHIEYHTNSYIKNSKRFVIPKSLYNQKYVTFGGKCVFSIEVLLRYASDLINMNQPMLERRLFENIWLIYSFALLKIFLSRIEEMEIPLNISNRAQRNSYFITQLLRMENDFTSFWSSHSLKSDCGNQCSKAIVLDGFQKPNRFAYQYVRDLIHSGDIEWGCGIRPEMIPDKQHSGYWKNTKYCPEHIHLENSQFVHSTIDRDDYDSIDCNVS
ncbi:unnamed protein product, partial [Rotaria magnacalcarata]